MFDYIKSAETAHRLIANFGQTLTIERLGAKSGPDYDPTYGPSTPHPVTAVVLDYNNADRDGTRIKTGDRKVLVSTEGLSIEPATEDTILIDGEGWNIVEVMPLRPAGTTVMYTLQVRK